ncbi:MAG: DUF3261 domain-containing protein [Victivallaceae bacterium]|nr:DUF3261 domain-containing protein [Victivallaceae bacterium]
MKVIKCRFDPMPVFALGMAVFAVCCLTGCATVEPFKRESLAPLPNSSTAEILTAWSKQQPVNFSATSGIVFHWRNRKMSTLCVAAVNRETGQISVVGMNLMGVKIFEATGNEYQAKMLFAAMKLNLEDPDAFATGMIRDIARIYFDNVPRHYVEQRTADLIHLCAANPGKATMQYKFGGSPVRLLEKQAVEDGSVSWRVRYFKYKSSDKLELPYAIVYDNLKHDYRLVIRLKKFAGSNAGEF